MYLTYDDYIAMGGKLTEAAFFLHESRARALIDRMTRGRIRDESPARESVRGAVYDLVAAMSADEGHAGREVTAVSNDGVSASYASGGASPVSRYAAIVRLWLEGEATAAGVSLLYAGVDV